MRLFGKVNSTIDRFDRATWMTPPFDQAFSTAAVIISQVIDGLSERLNAVSTSERLGSITVTKGSNSVSITERLIE